MGFFDKLFGLRKQSYKNTQNTNDTADYENEINTILMIMENLGLLDKNKLLDNLSSKKVNFDETLLERIFSDKKIPHFHNLERYYETNTIGYQEGKIEEFREELRQLNVDDLIEKAREYLDSYIEILKSFDDTIKMLEENISNKAELIGMIDYWTNYYKEQYLGYTVDLNDRIESMILELKLLPYGGYGEKEIKKFVNESYNIVAQGQTNNESSNKTYLRIKNTLFNQKKNRYMSDVAALKKKLSLINNSTYINDKEKEENKEKVIKEFNIMNGHVLNNEKQSNKDDNYTFLVEVNIEKLMNLPKGGYGPEAICSYRNQCKKIMDSKESDENKYIKINKTAILLEDIYYYNLDLFLKWKEQQLEGLNEKEREIKNEELDKKIKHMLSLSPKALNQYYIDDNNHKKEERKNHNIKVAFKYLAKKESKNTKNKDIYEQRLQEFENGIITYSASELEDAINHLEILSITSDKNDDDRIISTIEYIDNTLINQLMSLESDSKYVPKK